MKVSERCAGSSLSRVACWRCSEVAVAELVAVLAEVAGGRCVSSVVTLVVSCSSCVVSVATSVASFAVLFVTS